MPNTRHMKMVPPVMGQLKVGDAVYATFYPDFCSVAVYAGTTTHTFIPGDMDGFLDIREIGGPIVKCDCPRREIKVIKVKKNLFHKVDSLYLPREHVTAHIFEPNDPQYAEYCKLLEQSGRTRGIKTAVDIAVDALERASFRNVINRMMSFYE